MTGVTLDIATIAGVAGTVGAVIGGLITRGVDSAIKWKKAANETEMQARGQDHSNTVEGYQLAVSELKSHVGRMEARHDEEIKLLRSDYEKELKSSRRDHMECVERSAKLTVKVESLEEEVKGLREWRHDVQNVAHTAALKQTLKDASS